MVIPATVGRENARNHPVRQGLRQRPDPHISGIGDARPAAHTERMWEGRARTARRDIAALATSGLGVEALHAAAIDVGGAGVANDFVCWGSLDPATLVISSMTSGRNRIAPEYE